MRKGGNLKRGVGAGVFALVFLACLSWTAKSTGLVRNIERIASEIHKGSNVVKKPPAHIPPG